MKIKTGKMLIGKKINVVIILIVLLLFVTIAIPSFCMLLMKDNSEQIEYWNGSIASSYSSGDGTEANPYLITNGDEFAYLSQETNNGKTYDGKYFKLANNIHLNNGVIEYKNEEIIYTKDSIKYYIKPFTNEYYQDNEFKNKIGTINIFPKMKTFNGFIDGDNNFIYGLYITDEEDKTLSLFEEFKGKLNNLYFSNTLIYGNYSTSLINKTQNGTYSNLLFNGYICSKGTTKKIYNLNDIELTTNTKTINLTFDNLPESDIITKISLKGILNGEEIYINDNLINEENFELEFTELPSTLTIKTENLNNSLSNLIFEISYQDSITSLMNNFENSQINNVFIRGNITGNYITSPLIGKATNNIEINNVFNDANITGKNITSGLIGVMENASINMGNVYNSGNINGKQYSGGIFGAIKESYNVNLHDSFNTGTIIGDTKGAIAGTSTIDIIDHNNYYTNENMESVGNNNSSAGTHIDKSDLLKESFLTTNLKFSNTTWNISDNELPRLITFDNEEPVVTINLLDKSWNKINNKEIKITETTWLDIEYEDLQSDILKVEYHIGNKIYSNEEINNLEYDLYNDKISLEENGNYYIVLKTTDVMGNVNITTTDLINLDGYNLIISDIYNNSLKKYNNQISYDSSIKYNFYRNYKMESFIYPEEISYMIKTNIQLPDNTNIKLIDNIKNKIYTYTVSKDNISYINNSYMYDLSLFKELGTISNNYFDNLLINYYDNQVLKEYYDIIINFQNANIIKNEDIKIDLVAVYDDTIYSSTYTNLDNKFTLIKYDDNNKEVGYNFSLSTDYKDYIDMSQIKEYNININNQIIRSKLNDKDIYNEKINSDTLSLLIKIFDSNNKLVTGNLVNSLSIIYNDNTYYSNTSGYIKIPFNENNINLTLKTNYLINDILNGLYYLKINTCNNIGVCGEEETIPIKVSNTISAIDCNFTVKIDDNDRLISRSSGLNLNNRNNINIDIDYEGELSNPNIRIKMYKKLNFDSNNQVYELIDLSQYISNNFELIDNYQYYLVKEFKDNPQIKLNLLINKFEYGGYKLVFELYDGESFVKEDNKTFIVK